MTGRELAVLCRRALVEWHRNEPHFDKDCPDWEPMAWWCNIRDAEGRGARWHVEATVENMRQGYGPLQDRSNARYLVFMLIWPTGIPDHIARASVGIGPDMTQHDRGWGDHMDARDAAERVLSGDPGDGLGCWDVQNPEQRHPVGMLWDLVVRHYSKPSSLFPGDLLGEPQNRDAQENRDAQAENRAGVR